MGIDYKSLKQGGFMKQKQGDVFSVRLRVVGGKVTAEKLQKAAEVSQKYGQGYVHLTARQSIEIPFIPYEAIDDVRKSLAEAGLSPAVCGAGVRTITACHGDSVCANGVVDTYAMAEEIDRRFRDRELPHKFKIGITGCANNCLKAEENDLGIKGAVKVKWVKDKCIFCGACAKACKHDALKIDDGKIKIKASKCVGCGKCAKVCPKKTIESESGLKLYFGGLFGNQIQKGKNILPVITDEEAVYAVIDGTLAYFSRHADKGERFGRTLERIGWKEFSNKIKQVYTDALKA